MSAWLVFLGSDQHSLLLGMGVGGSTPVGAQGLFLALGSEIFPGGSGDHMGYW